jgi:hypothetical protein
VAHGNKGKKKPRKTPSKSVRIFFRITEEQAQNAANKANGQKLNDYARERFLT